MKKLLARLRARYVVIVPIEGKLVEHLASDMQDALSWMSCYNVEDNPQVYKLTLGVRGRWAVASRWDARSYSHA